MSNGENDLKQVQIELEETKANYLAIIERLGEQQGIINTLLKDTTECHQACNSTIKKVSEAIDRIVASDSESDSDEWWQTGGDAPPWASGANGE